MKAQEILRIGILTDCQYCDCPSGETRYYPLSLQKLDSCINDMNGQNLDAIFHLGDMIDHDFASYDSVLPRFRKFHPPLSLVYGNHDYIVQEKYKVLVPEKTGLGKGYYSRDIGTWRFIVLNGNDLSYLASVDKKQKEERSDLILGLISGLRSNMMPWNGGIGSIQMTWFEKLLKEADSLGRKVIVICHFPVYPFGWYNLWNDRTLVDLMTQHPSMKAYFNGHYHMGNYGCFNGIHFINFKGMVQTKANSYAIVTLTADSILVEGKGREMDRRLRISGK
ncbi:MAG: metallophosphoesterase [bacterium]